MPDRERGSEKDLKRLISRLRTRSNGLVKLSDIDRTMRWDNCKVSPETQAAIARFPYPLIGISGSSEDYIPPFLLRPFAFVEFGAAIISPSRYWLLPAADELEALDALRKLLNLSTRPNGYVQPGARLMRGRTVILGGNRYVSLNFIVGRHPAYPRIHADFPVDELRELLAGYMRREHMDADLDMTVTPFDGYHSIDIVTRFQKGDAVRRLQHRVGPAVKHWYYGGDGVNDELAMRECIPMVYSNSDTKLVALALDHQKAVIIDKPGPDGGFVEGLEIIRQRHPIAVS